MSVHLLQQWTTIQSVPGITVFTQSAEDWLDVSSFADAGFLIDVSQVSCDPGAIVQLVLQSSPTRDESYFGPVAPPVTLVPGSTSISTKSVRAASTVPLTGFLRWQLLVFNNVTATWGATFRVRAIPSQQSFFVPTDIAGCVLWLRADLGTTLVPSGTDQFVQQWNDQSATNDPNENLVQGNPSFQPLLNSANGQFNYAPTLTLSSASGTYMTSGSWATTLLQPDTWVLVANNTNIAAAQYLIDGDDTSTGQAVIYDPTAPYESIYAAGASFSASEPWSSPSALLGEWNGTTSNIYFDDFTDASATGTVNGGTSGGQGSMTFGMQNAAFGGGNNWDGDVAEIIAYGRILLPSEKALLRNYLNGRYALGII